jgi:hypothetical protein
MTPAGSVAGLFEAGGRVTDAGHRWQTPGSQTPATELTLRRGRQGRLLHRHLLDYSFPAHR